MAAYFRLESVLRHRKHLEDNAQKLFSDSSRRWEQARHVLDGKRHSRYQYERERKSKMNADATADELLRYHRYLGRLDSEIEAQRVLVENLAAEREEKRAQLMEALKNRRVIDKLKERFLENEARRGEAQEQKALNEAAIHRFQGNAERNGGA